MEMVTLHPTWHRLVDPEWIQALDATPFLTRCRAGTVTRSELHSYVRQQFYYSRNFTRFLCALLVNITDDRDRFELMKNLFEEMGLGAFGATPHSAIYVKMMAAMDVRPTDERERSGTSRLVAAMFECCRNENPMVGLSALGLGAEAIVPHLYSQVITGFQNVGERAENLEFFHIHVEGDDEHAVTMRNIIEREIAKDAFQRKAVHDAARRVIGARVRFFEDIIPKVGSLADRDGGMRAAV
jgi:pyrroloquinoline-quinone synthase